LSIKQYFLGLEFNRRPKPNKMKKRDLHAQCAYTEQRLIKAIDRFIAAKTSREKEKARRWAEAWRAARKNYTRPESGWGTYPADK